jgi:hypothetical protein
MLHFDSEDSRDPKRVERDVIGTGWYIRPRSENP